MARVRSTLPVEHETPEPRSLALVLVVGAVFGYFAGLLAYVSIGVAVNVLDRLLRGDGINFVDGAGHVAMLAFAFGGAALGVAIVVLLWATEPRGR